MFGILKKDKDFLIEILDRQVPLCTRERVWNAFFFEKKAELKKKQHNWFKYEWII